MLSAIKQKLFLRLRSGKCKNASENQQVFLLFSSVIFVFSFATRFQCVDNRKRFFSFVHSKDFYGFETQTVGSVHPRNITIIYDPHETIEGAN